MCKVPVKLRELVKQRLDAAAAEIFELLEKTITEYEEELISKYDQRRKLEAAESGPLSVGVPEWEPPFVIEDQDPPPIHIKEEQEEESSSQEATSQLWEREDTAPPIEFEEVLTPIQVSTKGEEEGTSETWNQPVYHNQTVDCPEPPVPVAASADHLLHHNNTVERQWGLIEALLQPSVLLNTPESVAPLVPPPEWAPSLPQDPLPLAAHIKEFGSVSVKTEEEEAPQTWTQPLHHTPTVDCLVPPVPVAASGVPLVHHNNEAHTSNNNPHKHYRKTPNLVKSHMFPSSFKAFPSNSMFERHMRVYTGDRPFMSSVGGKRFALKETLATRSLNNNGLKLFSCFVCAKKFSLKTDLKRHMRVHTGEKPFSCSDCGKRFSLKGNMEQHKKIHSGLKPFACTVCGKAFFQKANLNNHLLVHTSPSAAPFVENSSS